jgi:hypothetical protein
MSTRSIFASHDPAFDSYPHNAAVAFALPQFPAADISSMPTAQLATTMRRAVHGCRNSEYVRSYIRYVNELGGNAAPLKRRGVDYWMVSNQCLADLDRIDYGAEQRLSWFWMLPVMADHSMSLRKFNGGYIIQSGMRKARWVTVEREVERLQALHAEETDTER